MFMSRAVLPLAVVCLVGVSIAAQTARIPAGVLLYVEPTEFGQALSAAILKKRVPVRITTDREKAAYFLASASEAKKEGTGERVAKVVMLGAFAGSGKSFDASVTVTDTEGSVLFAYSSKKSNFQSAAEGVAKNLKKHIEGK
jgi:Pyruvate/2-oxoacid:ferredoxin oxidoreductase gamma subunit